MIDEETGRTVMVEEESADRRLCMISLFLNLIGVYLRQVFGKASLNDQTMLYHGSINKSSGTQVEKPLVNHLLYWYPKASGLTTDVTAKTRRAASLFSVKIRPHLALQNRQSTRAGNLAPVFRIGDVCWCPNIPVVVE
jgi:hypothetical protein